jgi:hypothetical protein
MDLDSHERAKSLTNFSLLSVQLKVSLFDDRDLDYKLCIF